MIIIVAIFALLIGIGLVGVVGVATKGKGMFNIKKIYLFAVSLISLVIFVIGAIQIIDLGLKAWVFTRADQDFYFSECARPAALPGPDGKTVPECTAEQKTAAEEQAADNRTAQKQREAATALAMIIVSAPVFFLHWRLAKREA
jgi:hypothetical protein